VDIRAEGSSEEKPEPFGVSVLFDHLPIETVRKGSNERANLFTIRRLFAA
jgi:hypothetical protein